MDSKTPWFRRTALPLLLLLAVVPVRSDVVPASPFRDHAVLQRERAVPVWGMADAGERVTVTFGDGRAETVAGPDGRWLVELTAMPASGAGRELVIRGKNEVRVADVVVGEVWLASGQSNMAWAVGSSQNAEAEIAAAAYPLVREFRVDRNVADAPAAEVKGAWRLAQPADVHAFSAVGYFFARDLHQVLGVPVGIVNSTWGGTPVEAWMSEESLASDAAFGVVLKRWDADLKAYPERKARHDAEMKAWEAARDAAKAKGEAFTQRAPGGPRGPGHPHGPSVLYNGMIAPLVPYALRGTIWYQGESNAGRAGEYRALFSAMITDWRGRFRDPLAPFYWVQLASYEAGDPGGAGWGAIREAQSQTLALPSTGQVITLDIGDPKDIHPRNKQDVGKRLALLARNRVYGEPVVDRGPHVVESAREGTAWRLRFAGADDRLVVRGGVTGFELAGGDRVFHPAEAEVNGATVLVRSAAVPDPVAVRYAWRNVPAVSLFGSTGLPAEPYRSDSW